MKLRNKKTGKVFDAIIREKGGGDTYSIIVCNIEEYSKPPLARCILGEYDSLAKLYEEWEDYMSKEPLIKDEKIRKVVNAWAEVNNLSSVLYNKDEDCIYSPYGSDDNDLSISISFDEFGVFKGLEHKKEYTIKELCGDEE